MYLNVKRLFISVAITLADIKQRAVTLNAFPHFNKSTSPMIYLFVTACQTLMTELIIESGFFPHKRERLSLYVFFSNFIIFSRKSYVCDNLLPLT